MVKDIKDVKPAKSYCLLGLNAWLPRVRLRWAHLTLQLLITARHSQQCDYLCAAL